MRFSDEQLQDFYEQFIEHSKTEEHMHAAYTARIADYERSQQELRDTLEDTTDALNSLTHSISSMLTAWEIAQGAWKFTGFIGGVAKWVAGVSIAVATLWYMIKQGGAPK